jgi:hypothetical protein
MTIVTEQHDAELVAAALSGDHLLIQHRSNRRSSRDLVVFRRWRPLRVWGLPERRVRQRLSHHSSPALNIPVLGLTVIYGADGRGQV